MKKLVAALAAAAALLGAAPAPAEAQTLIRIASLAPEGSSWMRLFHAWSSAVDKRTAGAVKIKFFAGGVAGDEKDVVRKMKLGALEGGALTAIGLGQIQPMVRVLELPYLFRAEAELDHVRQVLDGDFHKMFQDKGYVLLAWGDVGPVHLFGARPFTDVAALRAMKIWLWTDDGMTAALFGKLQLGAVKMGVPDVLPALQTGGLNAFYGSPLSTLALQWNTKVKYMTAPAFGQSIGATIITKKAWDTISPANQKIFAEETKILADRLQRQIRGDNIASFNKMKELGIQVVTAPADVEAEFRKAATASQPDTDAIYTAAFRQRVQGIVDEYRKSHPAP